jgi:hypothetical protein
VWARLTNGDPLWIEQRFGRGEVMLSTVPFDADWSTLPAQPDFVVLMHELLFHLASHGAARNVDVGVPLVSPLGDAPGARDYVFFAPDGREIAPRIVGEGRQRQAVCEDTWQPGVYRFGPRRSNSTTSADNFVVRGDRRESDLTRLDEAQRAQLAADGRLTFLPGVAAWKQRAYTDTSRVELSAALLLLFLVMLVGEVLMTRRLVRGGHVEIDAEQ